LLTNVSEYVEGNASFAFKALKAASAVLFDSECILLLQKATPIELALLSHFSALYLSHISHCFGRVLCAFLSTVRFLIVLCAFLRTFLFLTVLCAFLSTFLFLTILCAFLSTFLFLAVLCAFPYALYFFPYVLLFPVRFPF
jgi:hypothetical protein